MTAGVRQHGTATCYRRGCRRPECRAAHNEYQRAYRNRAPEPLRITDLLVECWCRTECVWVPRAEVMAVLTRSCGRPGCKAPNG